MRKWMTLGLAALAWAISTSGAMATGLDAALARKAALRPNATFSVVIFLKRQPGYEVSEASRLKFEPQIESVAGQLQAIQSLKRPQGLMTRDQEKAWLARQDLRAMSAPELALCVDIDTLKNQFMREVGDELDARTAPDHAALASKIEALGGHADARLWSVSAVIAHVPGRALAALDRDDLVATIFESGPNGAELNTSVPSVGAPSFWAGGFTGGAFDIGVLDVSAVQQNHPGFAGKRFESNIGAVDGNGHPTNCCGILCSGDATYKGVAPGLDSIASSMVNGTAVMMTNMNWMITQTNERPENVNYSITDGTVNASDYINVDQFFDGVTDTFNFMVSKSAGNNGFGTGAPTITRPAPAYNLMACASLNDQADTNRANDRISSYSSRGPTPGGRRKPDIAAPGENITTLASSGGVLTNSGTSFAAPHVGGAVILLLNRGVVDPMTAKAVLINTADAMNDAETASTTDDTFVAGSFWNRRYGWGYMNLNQALLHATDWFSAQMPAPASGGHKFRLYKGSAFANDKATLVWNRHVGYNGANFPTIIRSLSNLDLIAYNASNNLQIAQSVSTIDNVEQLSVAVASPVVYKVVTNGLFDAAITQERYALATEEGFTTANGPVFQASANGTGEFAVNTVGGIVVTVKNTGDLPAYNVTAQLTTQTVVGGPNPFNFGTVLPGQTVQHIFNVNTGAFAGEFYCSATITSASYGETFSGVGDGALEVGGV